MDPRTMDLATSSNTSFDTPRVKPPVFARRQVVRQTPLLVTPVANGICERYLSATKNNTRKECARASAHIVERALAFGVFGA